MANERTLVTGIQELDYYLSYTAPRGQLVSDISVVEVSISDFFKTSKERHKDHFHNCELHFTNSSTIAHIDNIEFSECLFSDQRWENILLDDDRLGTKSLTFKNCTFEKSFTITKVQNVTLRTNEESTILFVDSVFNGSVLVEKISTAKDKKIRINFEGGTQTTTLPEISIRDANSVELTLKNIQVSKAVQINNVSSEFALSLTDATIAKLITKEVKVSSPVYLANSCSYDFSHTTFESKVVFDEVRSQSERIFKASYCEFKDIVRLNRSRRSKIEIEDSVFLKKLWIADALIYEMKFLNCRFEDTVKIFDLTNAIKSADFSLSTIKGLFLFNGWNKRLNFAPDATIDFSHIYIESGGYLIIRNINSKDQYSGNFKFNCANILGVVVFTDVYAQSLDLEYSSIVGSFNAENIHIREYQNSQTLVRLKNEALKKSDTIAALEYKADGLRAYRKELKTKPKNHCAEKILLCLNNISSSHGQKWEQGLLFTVAVAIFFQTILFLLNGQTTFDIDQAGTYCKSVLSFLWIADVGAFGEFFANPNTGFWSAFVFLFGKIAVGYGIYQTISAFRKYGK